MAEIEYKYSDCVYNNLPVDYYNSPCSDCTNIDLKWRPKETKMKDFTQKEAAKIRRYAEWLEQAISGQTIDPRK